MRLFHRLYALIFGYFWLPCPVCRRYFGGHEKGGGCYWIDETTAKITCPQCPGDYGTE